MDFPTPKHKQSCIEAGKARERFIEILGPDWGDDITPGPRTVEEAEKVAKWELAHAKGLEQPP